MSRGLKLIRMELDDPDEAEGGVAGGIGIHTAADMVIPAIGQAIEGNSLSPDSTA